MSTTPNTQNTPDRVQKLTLDMAREQMKQARGRRYWRTLEELAGRKDFGAMLEREMPRQAATADWDPVDRRDFLRLMGASLALGGLTACTRQPNEHIVPYVHPPEEIIPGKPLFFATSTTLAGYALGVLAESHMGRPTKIEGNPEHPASLGATDSYAQAQIWNMYDPDRSQSILNRGRVGNWDQFIRELDEAMAAQSLMKGAGLRVVTETVTSPSLAALLRELLAKYPSAKWVQYEPVNRERVHAATKLAFGESLDPVYHFDKATTILSLDADFLSSGPGHVRYARDFGAHRQMRSEPGHIEMNRLYAVESALTVTGSNADHRLPVRPSQVEGIARAVARGLGIDTPAADVHGHEAWVDAVVADLKKHRGSAVVVAGEQQSEFVQALAAAMNDVLDAAGRTVTYHAPAVAEPAAQTADFKALVADMNAGSIDAMIVLGGNPAYYAPADLPFAAAFDKVKFRAHVGLHVDETASLSHWHIPEAHFLEAWGDARAFDGTPGIVQPLIEPLYSGKSILEIASALVGRSSKKGYDIVRDYWKTQLQGDFEKAWRKSVHDGVIAGAASTVKTPKLVRAFLATAPAAAHDAKSIELLLAEDASAFDGRFANNAWLQELPRATTTIVWDNALLIGPKTAETQGWKTNEVIELTTSAGRTQAAVYVSAAIASGTAVLSLGYGRRKGGRNLLNCGFNAYAVRSSASPWTLPVECASLGTTYEIVTTQEQHEMPVVHEPQETTLAAFADKPDFIQRHHLRTTTSAAYNEHPDAMQHFEESVRDSKTGKALSLYADFDYSKGNQWGLVFNLSACIGCNACMIACMAENNISVVGKDQCSRRRDMHWIRVDRYFSGDRETPMVSYQPVPCQHCENAPCEAVCPVAATTHSRDGLNQMIYNRCVGTRYCSNNCPYKVRRFNFYKFADHETPSFKLMRNPDVTVRSRGVMEKCTYCIQRISEARIDAKKKLRDIQPGEVVTACQQVCPTRAIVFGDINNPQDPIHALRQSKLHYGIFEELATRPRTTYLARVRNPNPILEPAGPGGGHGHGESQGHSPAKAQEHS